MAEEIKNPNAEEEYQPDLTFYRSDIPCTNFQIQRLVRI